MDLLTAFSSVEDPRRTQGLRVSLEQILVMSVLSYLCGHSGYRGISRFCKAYSKRLTKLLSLKHAVPSHVTFFDVLSRIDQDQVIAAFNDWAGSFVDLNTHIWVSADGKALGSTVTNSDNEKQDFQCVVSLFAQQSGLVYSLEQYRNKEKGKGEPDVLKFLIGQLGAMGAIIRVDALHTQKKP